MTVQPDAPLSQECARLHHEKNPRRGICFCQKPHPVRRLHHRKIQLFRAAEISLLADRQRQTASLHLVDERDCGDDRPLSVMKLHLPLVQPQGIRRGERKAHFPVQIKLYIRYHFYRLFQAQISPCPHRLLQQPSEHLPGKLPSGCRFPGNLLPRQHPRLIRLQGQRIRLSFKPGQRNLTDFRRGIHNKNPLPALLVRPRQHGQPVSSQTVPVHNPPVRRTVRSHPLHRVLHRPREAGV